MKNCLINSFKSLFFYDAHSDLQKWKKLRIQLLEAKKKSVIYHIRKLQYKKIMTRNSAWIGLSTKLGDNISFPHGLSGIFCSSGGGVIGDNCTIMQQVTIGSNTMLDSKHKGFPIIGNNVFIGAGAKIIGGVSIGDNVRIGANTTICKDIPSNCTVVSSESIRIIPHEHIRNNRFIGFNEYTMSGKNESK